eukprot:gb/GECH01006689.1/.p1 GENE.gb/GECH01006689.1/~~gb/GECH01006689.1/.p1  ORF type:complete len:635 (+),score=109.59 gb/GECH01006689.1/:1-1905(+)
MGSAVSSSLCTHFRTQESEIFFKTFRQWYIRACDEFEQKPNQRVLKTVLSELLTGNPGNYDTEGFVLPLRGGLSDDAVIMALTETMLKLKGRCFVRGLDLADNLLTNRGVQQLCSAMENGVFLEYLDFSDNIFNVEGLCFLAAVLTTYDSLETLKMNGSRCDTCGASRLLYSLADNTSLKQLELQSSGINDDSRTELALLFSKNQSLESIDLRLNPISDEAINFAIEEGLVKNRFICSLLFGSNRNLEPSCIETKEYVLSRNDMVRNIFDAMLRNSMRKRFSVRPKMKLQRTLSVELPEFSESMKNKYMKMGISELKGRRPTMEDAATIITNFRGIPDETFIGVYDGHGGPQVSEFLSRNLHQIFAKKLDQYEEIKIEHDTHIIFQKKRESSHGSFYQNSPPKGVGLNPASGNPKRPSATTLSSLEDLESAATDEYLDEDDAIQVLLRESFLEANDTIYAQSIPNGSTAAVVFMRGERCFVANAGDTRIVLCRNSGALRLSVDHRPIDPEEADRISNLGGFVSKDFRVNGVLGVSRALGDSFLEPMVIADPYTNVVELSDKDEFLIIACDGVWDVVNDNLAVTTIREINDPRLASAHLRDFAYLQGSQDNITVVVATFNPSAFTLPNDVMISYS